MRTQALGSYPQHCHPSVRSERVQTKNNWFCGARDLLLFMREFDYFVYIMASRSRVLYTGVTNNLSRRVFEHKSDRIEGFTKRYRVHRLVYFESYNYVEDAIKREKEVKRWVRQRRVELIESMNPTWEDLAVDLVHAATAGSRTRHSHL